MRSRSQEWTYASFQEGSDEAWRLPPLRRHCAAPSHDEATADAEPKVKRASLFAKPAL